MKKLSLVVGFIVLLSTLAVPAYAQHTKSDLALDFGASGLWLHYADAGFRQLHPLSPEEMVSGDVDGNGLSDLIVDFPGQGVWLWLNDSQWLQLNSGNAAHIITAALDGNGKQSVLVDFPGKGIWVWRYTTGWSQLHPFNAHLMTAGDLDGSGRAEVLIDFTGYGVWVLTNSQSWRQLLPNSVTSMAVGDIDGSGRPDVLLDFPGAGIWLWLNNASWYQLNTRGASLMTTGDLDGNGQAEIIADFAGHGLWVWRYGAGWLAFHALDAEGFGAADLDGNGRRELVVDFGAPGLWVWNNGNWTRLHALSPEGGVAGNFYLPPPPPPPPTVSFGPGTYRVGSAARFFTDPSYGCYWERLNGRGEIIANNFVGYDAGQQIVDLRATDYAFYTDADCGTWYSTPRRGLQANITPGMWLVGGQVAPGMYMSYVNYGCYWERLANFDGSLSAIIDNDFVDAPGLRYVQVSASDVGFQTDGDCGTWQRVSAATASVTSQAQVNSVEQSSSDIEENRTKRRRKDGVQ